MVKSIINVRRFLRYAGVVRGTDNGRQKTEIMVIDVIVAESYLLIINPPSQTCRLNPKLNQRAPDATGFFPVGGMPTASSLCHFSPKEKSGRCGIAAGGAWRFT